MKLQLLAGVALAAVFAAGAASAQETGWYGAVDLGYHWPEGINSESELNAPDGARYHYTWSTDEDWAGFVRLGYQFNPNWRAEVEAAIVLATSSASAATRFVSSRSASAPPA